MNIRQLSAKQAQQYLPTLSALLEDAVNSGGSLGFLPPLAPADAAAYWQSVLAALQTPERLLFVAMHEDAVIGTVQLQLESRPNGAHRAEIIKLMVASSARRQGVASALMHAAETAARDAQRSLLLLDTRLGDHAEQLYERLGYLRGGVIPGYARGADGAFHATVFMYKVLEESAP